MAMQKSLGPKLLLASKRTTEQRTYIPDHTGISYNETTDHLARGEQNPLDKSNYTLVMSETGCGCTIKRPHPREDPGGLLAGGKIQASSSDVGLRKPTHSSQVRRVTSQQVLGMISPARLKIYSGQAGCSTTACEVYQKKRGWGQKHTFNNYPAKSRRISPDT